MKKFNLINFRNTRLPSEAELIAKWEGKYTSPKVSFVCTTFNHEEFIGDTIRGFLLQETAFPIEILIHDDASTDNTASIIQYFKQLYPNIIRSTFQTENQYSRDRHFPLHYLFKKAKGKYIAICEGDDFWVCRSKISQQVTIFEQNSKISLVYGKAYIYLVGKDNVSNGLVGNAMARNSIYIQNGIPTLTVMFKKDLLKGFIEYVGESQKDWLQSDYQLWMWFNMQGDIYFQNKVTSVYRVLGASASRPAKVLAQYKYRLSVLFTSLYFAKRNCEESTLKHIISKKHTFLYLWCLKRKLPEAEKHKHEVLSQLSTVNKIVTKTLIMGLVERVILPIYFLLGKIK